MARMFLRTAHRLAAALLLVFSCASLVLGGVASAAPPVDHKPTAPNDSSELAGSGYLLSDPGGGASHAYWAGAYRTLSGLKSYCVDRFYDYPRPGYGYRSAESARWPGRPGSNSGPTQAQAARIAWIVNSYGQSSAPRVTAAVSMAVNLLVGSPSFTASYHRYFAAQLRAIDARIVPLVEEFLADSDRFAGPYTTRVTFGAAPPVGGRGTVAISVRSARGVSVRNARFEVVSIAGAQLASPSSGATGPSGVARVAYLVTKPGRVAVTARGSGPNTSVRLGSSPSHSGSSFATGSQRVVAVSARALATARPGAGSIEVIPPQVSTAVHFGAGPRTPGTDVQDEVTARGLLPGEFYELQATLLDASGARCGTVARALKADAVGEGHEVMPPVRACGTGRNTFVVAVIDSHRRSVAVSPPWQPTETFPIAPAPPSAVPSSPQPSSPQPSNPGPSNPGPSNPGPSNPGPSNPLPPHAAPAHPLPSRAIHLVGHQPPRPVAGPVREAPGRSPGLANTGSRLVVSALFAAVCVTAGASLLFVVRHSPR